MTDLNPTVARRRRGGRRLISYFDPQTGLTNDPGWPEAVREASSQISRLTAKTTIPAPVVWDVLTYLAPGMESLGTALERLATGLEASLEEYDLEELRGGTPEETVQTASKHLREASEAAHQIGRSLREVRVGLGWQVAHPKGTL